MKIALSQLNPILGDCAGNTQKIQRAMETAAAAGARLVVFPELAVTGYPPQDLLDTPALVEASMASVVALAKFSKKITAVVGFVDRNPSSIGKPFFNAAALLRDGKVEAVYYKRLLPSYDVFDDERYFQAGTRSLHFELDGDRFAVHICEDSWNLPGFVPRAYDHSPLDAAREAKARWILNLSASPFHVGKPELREKLLKQATATSKAGILFCNQVGANDDLIFDGTSLAMSRDGAVLARAGAFAEDLLFVETSKDQTLSDLPTSEPEWMAEALQLGVRDYVAKTGSRGVCLGLSGGIDSSVVAALAVRALGPEHVQGVLLPTRYTSDASNEDAMRLAKQLGIQTVTLPIQGLFDTSISVLEAGGVGPLAELTRENLQPRLRMSLLMAFSNHSGFLLLNTSNKSELAVGYATLYGDSAGALAVLGDCTKDQVVALARYFNRERETIPARVLDRPPSAELRENQKDEDSLPPYRLLDPMVREAVERQADRSRLLEKAPPDAVDGFLSLYRINEYKRRQFPPILRVSPHAFGRGRRIPVASRKPW